MIRKGNCNPETYPRVVVARKQRHECKKILMCFFFAFFVIHKKVGVFVICVTVLCSEFGYKHNKNDLIEISVPFVQQYERMLKEARRAKCVHEHVFFFGG